MKVHQLHDAPPAELAAALAQFEGQFTYPLGPGRRFRISHGDDYPRFFRAMGEAACFVIEHEGVVLAAIGAAIRRLVLPDGSARPALYMGDLKVTITARGGYALLELAKAMEPWIRPRAAVGFGIVMDGTAITPDRYTGKLGIPQFNALAKIVVLRVPTEPTGVQHGHEQDVATTDFAALFLDLAAGSFICPDSNPAERSHIEPQWIVHPDDAAIGRLEDTHRAKRLIADDGIEMPSAHLSCFAYRDIPAGVELLHAARHRAGTLGFPAMFVAAPADQSQTFIEKLALRDIVAAPATIYGTGIEPGHNWIINTSEI